MFLYKNEDFAPFVRNSNSLDFLKDASFATNGQVLLLQTNTHAYFFEVKTGVRIFKHKFPAEDEKINVRLVYDYQQNVFFTFKHSNANTRMEVMQITNIKKGGVSFGFTKDYLQSRLGDFRTQVFGESPQDNGKVIAPHKLNLIQRIMKNVTTPVLIQHSRDTSIKESSSISSEANLPKLTSTLILRYIEKAS